MKDSGCHLVFAKLTNPNIIKVAAKSTCMTTWWLYNWLEVKNRCPIKEANWISLIYLMWQDVGNYELHFACINIFESIDTRDTLEWNTFQDTLSWEMSIMTTTYKCVHGFDGFKNLLGFGKEPTFLAAWAFSCFPCAWSKARCAHSVPTNMFLNFESIEFSR